jgi:hypothetical protein
LIERAAGLVVHSHVPAVHVERHAIGLARQPKDLVLKMLLPTGQWQDEEEE